MAIGLNQMSGPKTCVNHGTGKNPRLQTQTMNNYLDKDTRHGRQLPLVNRLDSGFVLHGLKVMLLGVQTCGRDMFNVTIQVGTVRYVAFYCEKVTPTLSRYGSNWVAAAFSSGLHRVLWEASGETSQQHPPRRAEETGP
ncbi:hypothetical protein Taro_019144 [Colocasia esculenta]|uniref:Uncharacterized protein n=1 Tax=Colocasia esculenta TaxID=4460 RepID=A0A843USN7_COLES|nr:hypothetical protein [Colocasia esculenta]